MKGMFDAEGNELKKVKALGTIFTKKSYEHLSDSNIVIAESTANVDGATHDQIHDVRALILVCCFYAPCPSICSINCNTLLVNTAQLDGSTMHDLVLKGEIQRCKPEEDDVPTELRPKGLLWSKGAASSSVPIGVLLGAGTLDVNLLNKTSGWQVHYACTHIHNYY